MSLRFQQTSMAARRAVQARDWTSVQKLARDLIKLDSRQPEGHFLLGMAAKMQRVTDTARQSFERALKLDGARYDAGVELAALRAAQGEYAEADAILSRVLLHIGDSPLYLSQAASILMQIGKWADAWPLLQRANNLQPGVGRIMASQAECAVSLGKIDDARALYSALLQQNPLHQRNHYQLARLATASNDEHLQVMRNIVEDTTRPPADTVFVHYAMGKEFEDLERWQEAFVHYKAGGDAAARIAATDYSVEQDLALIDTLIHTCNAEWYSSSAGLQQPDTTPVFVVGLPRTGTTLLERVLSSHSQVETAGETVMIEQAMRGRGGFVGDIGPQQVRDAAAGDLPSLAKRYLASTSYLLQGSPFFIEKYTYNFLYLGIIAAAFPTARLVHLRRNPMDACFAMYKQPYFRFAYTLDDLGQFYVAYRELMQHWRDLLGERLVEVDYEALVAEQEPTTRGILSDLRLEFEPETLHFERNRAPSSTASSVQVREKVHTRSVDRWRRFEQQLEPLSHYLTTHGIDIDGKQVT